MTHPKYLIILFVLLLCSCGNNPTDITEANTYYTDKPIDSVKKEIERMRLDTAVYSTWTKFQQAILTKDFKTFKQISLDSLKCCDTTYSLTQFSNKCFSEVFDTALTNKFRTPKDINEIDKTMELGYFSNHVLKIADYSGNAITLKQFQIVKELTTDGAWTMTFDFIKTNDGYRFFGCDSYGGPICCR